MMSGKYTLHSRKWGVSFGNFPKEGGLEFFREKGGAGKRGYH